MEVRQTVLAILADQALLEPGDVEMDQTPADLGLDSMGMVECVFAIEEAFDIEVPFNANAPANTDASAPGEGGLDISTVAAIVAGVERLVARQKAGQPR